MSTLSEEEQQKKNTDCVYFLASPLTCKKGNECEFRHSESARINPRDCWFWISGNCLNGNCSFRHPPLEGRPAATAVTTATAAKSRVPCYYYAQGYCAKGDKCGFHHGTGQVATTETAVSHKLPKPKSSEPNEKQVSTSKGNGSVTSKPSSKMFPQMQAHTETRTPFTEAPFSGVKDESGINASNVLSRMPEGSGSSAPSRSRNLQDVSESNRSKRAPLLENMAQQPAGDNFVHLSLGEDEIHEVQTEDLSLHDGQAEDEMVHQTHSGEERIENGTESEELLEESSFDVLVDDGGDQIIYTDEFDYLPPCDVLMDPVSGHIQGRMIGAEDLADFEYDPAYFDGTAAEYDLAAFDSYQQVGYEHLVAYDYAGERTTGGWMDGERGIRDRREAALEEQPRRGVSSNDLRNHLVKRRRAERSQKHGEDQYRRRHQDLMANGSQERYRHQENFLQQQDSLGRRRKIPQAGTRSNRQNYGQQESLSRQSHGQPGFLGNKRAFRDIGSDYDRNSTERSSYKKSRNVGEPGIMKAKKEHGRATLVDADYLHSRGPSFSNNKRGLSNKEDSSFAAPKSLAQIRAEKLKSCDDDENSTYGESNSFNLLEVDYGSRRQVPPLRSQISPALKDHGKALPQTFSTGIDFKGPKPLSEILKEKRKDVDGEQIQETRSLAKGLEEGPNLTNGALISSLHVVKSQSHVNDSLHERSSYDDEKSSQGGARLGLSLPYKGREKQDENEEVRHGPHSLYDPAERAEPGDSAMDDVEFDDDDEDDFAKKLGGLFS